jgi:hypothetical protein
VGNMDCTSDFKGQRRLNRRLCQMNTNNMMSVSERANLRVQAVSDVMCATARCLFELRTAPFAQLPALAASVYQDARIYS